jgi:hypothetical protein
VTFQIGVVGELNMTVFCRSNDIIWGCYGANAVHFSYLLEYMAAMINCPVGWYTQISVNWHAYLEILKSMPDLPRDSASLPLDISLRQNDPYDSGEVHPIMLVDDIKDFDRVLREVMDNIDKQNFRFSTNSDFLNMFTMMMQAHYFYKGYDVPECYDVPLELLRDSKIDWLVAAREWLQRRRDKWEAQQVTLGEA